MIIIVYVLLKMALKMPSKLDAHSIAYYTNFTYRGAHTRIYTKIICP
jgi:hypothetical protein